MIAYNSLWRESLGISREAKRWSQSNIISGDQYRNIRSAYVTPLYSPNIFIRIALFLFACVCLLSIFGLIVTGGLFNSTSGIRVIGTINIILGSACIGLLEYVIRKKNLYRAGIDDALLYGGLVFLMSGIYVVLFAEGMPPYKIIPWLIAFPLLIAGLIRYADTLVTVAAYTCMIGIICVAMFEGSALVKLLVPFMVLVVSLGVYALAKEKEENSRIRPWEECRVVIEVLSLCTLYLAGNYLIVRQMREQYLWISTPQEGDIPFALAFYVLTVIVPVIYVVYGLRKKDHIMFRVGLCAAVFSAFTFKYYFSLGHPEIILIIAGGVLITAALITIRRLKSSSGVFTHENILKSGTAGLDIEGVVLSQAVRTEPVPVSEKKFEGGGGEFGGGGSQSTW